MADAAGLSPVARKSVGVQVPPLAPIKRTKKMTKPKPPRKFLCYDGPYSAQLKTYEEANKDHHKFAGNQPAMSCPLPIGREKEK